MFSKKIVLAMAIIFMGIAGCYVLYNSLGLGVKTTTPSPLPVYWPTDSWKSSSPDSLGLNSIRLNTMITRIKTTMPTIDSVLVIRHGYIAVEEYFGSYNATTKHHVYSCTKSVVSTLVGIALDGGEIPSLDARVLDLLPEYMPGNMNDWKHNLTLKNLLTMTSGIDARDDYPDNWIWLDRLIEADDAVRYGLDLNVTVQPGTRFKYTNANSHLLSAIIIEKTGEATLTYAREKLFEPLGITDVKWRNDSKGRQWGFYGLFLRPQDMAKFGYLFLHDGFWDGRRIVSEAWIKQAVSRKIDSDIFPGYGFQWWVSERDGYYCAMGYAGQFIYVFPEKDMIVVFTGHNEENFENPRRLLNEYILPAVES